MRISNHSDCFDIVSLPVSTEVAVDRETAIHFGLKPSYQGNLKAVTRRTKLDIVNLARTMGPDMLGVLHDIAMSRKYSATDRRGAAEQVLRWGFGAPISAVSIFNTQNNVNIEGKSEGDGSTTTDDLLSDNNPLKGLGPEKQKAYLIETMTTLAEALGPKPPSLDAGIDPLDSSAVDEFREDSIEAESHRVEDKAYLEPNIPVKPKASMKFR